MTDFVVAGTGSRSLRVADRAVQVEAMERCTAALREHQAERGPNLIVMSGGAEGWDELIARVAIKLGIFLWLALPTRSYAAYYWGRASVTGRDRRGDFAGIFDSADRVTYVMEQVHGTTELKLNGLHANFWRNLWMVNGGPDGFAGADDFLVLGPVEPRSGTDHCVKAIKAAGKWRPDMVLSAEPAALLP